MYEGEAASLEERSQDLEAIAARFEAVEMELGVRFGAITADMSALLEELEARRRGKVPGHAMLDARRGDEDEGEEEWWGWRILEAGWEVFLARRSPRGRGPFGGVDLPFGDLRPDARFSSLSLTLGIGRLFWTGSLDLVRHGGRIGVFWSPRGIGTRAEQILLVGSDDTFPLVTPQLGLAYTEGLLFGDVFYERGVSAYEGPFTYVGGTAGPITGEVFASSSAETGGLTGGVSGVGGGLSLGIPAAEGHLFVTNSRLILDLPDPLFQLWHGFRDAAISTYGILGGTSVSGSGPEDLVLPHE
jgi:hypothetical protein